MSASIHGFRGAVGARSRALAGVALVANRRGSRQAQATWAARQAERSARKATERLLGSANAAGSAWWGRADGTAIGRIEGQTYTWEARAGRCDQLGQLTLHRSC